MDSYAEGILLWGCWRYRIINALRVWICLEDAEIWERAGRPHSIFRLVAISNLGQRRAFSELEQGDLSYREVGAVGGGNTEGSPDCDFVLFLKLLC